MLAVGPALRLAEGPFQLESGALKCTLLTDVPDIGRRLDAHDTLGVQELGEKENIRVGVFQDPKTFVKLPLDKEDLEPPVAEQPAIISSIDSRIARRGSDVRRLVIARL